METSESSDQSVDLSFRRSLAIEKISDFSGNQWLQW